MKRVGHGSGCLAAIFLGLSAMVLPPSPAWAAYKVAAVGDSWAHALAPLVERQFDVHGHRDLDVLNIAVPGATARAYAGNVGGILDLTLTTISSMPDLEYVMILLGGNDLFGDYPLLGRDVFSRIELDLRHIVSRVLAARPDIQILMPGYDILKFNKSDVCLALAYVQLGVVWPWEVNPLFLEIGTRQNLVADSFPTATYVSLWGTGQGRPGNPDLLAWSPLSYVAAPDDDCVHLSDAGYSKFAAQMYTAYFASRFPPVGCGSLLVPPRSARNGARESSSGLSGGLFLLLGVTLALGGWRLAGTRARFSGRRH